MIHVNICSNIIKSFKWVSPVKLLPHEQIQSSNVKRLTINSVVPAIVACSNTGLIIDGHHRYEAFTYMKINKIPVLYLDYFHKDIITHPYLDIDKLNIINDARNKRLMIPKSTKHCIWDLDGNILPIATLSPNCLISMYNQQIH